MTDLPKTCINCGSTLTGQFCSQCGEKVFSKHDKTVKHFLHEAFHFITHLDGKFLKSLKLLFFKPGFLSQEYCRGIRKAYFKPVSLFLIAVIIYLFVPIIKGLNMPHSSNISTFNFIHIGIVEDISVRKAARENITLEELGERYDAKSPKISKILLLLLIPFSTAILWLLFFRKRDYLFDHLILSTEINTLFVYTIFLLIPLILTGVGKLLLLIADYDFDYGDSILAPLQAIVLSVGWAVALRRFYGIGRWEVIWKTFVFFILHSILVFIVYRLILFLVVMLFI